MTAKYDKILGKLRDDDSAGYAALSGATFTGKVTTAVPTTSLEPFVLSASSGVNPSSPTSGSLWWNGTNLNFYNGSSTTDLLAGGGGLSHFTEAQSTTSPNNSIYVSSLTASGSASHVDAALSPKGSGAVLADVPDATATGGDKRGVNAVDFQTSRLNANQVAGGSSSVVSGGSKNRASATGSTVSGGYEGEALANYSAVSGGFNNAITASGQYSAISGGRENNISSSYAAISGGYGNTASNSYGFVGGGTSNTASGDTSTVSGGSSNVASGTRSVISGGSGNAASGSYGFVGGGASNTSSGQYSMANGYFATTRGIYGMQAYASGRFSSQGDAQTGLYLLREETTDATAAALVTNSFSATSNNQVIVANNSAYTFKGIIVARENSTGDAKFWEITGAIEKGATVGTTALVGTPTVTTVAEDSGASAWSVSLSADTSNGALKIAVTGEASHTIKWVARVETVEVSG